MQSRSSPYGEGGAFFRPCIPCAVSLSDVHYVGDRITILILLQHPTIPNSILPFLTPVNHT